MNIFRKIIDNALDRYFDKKLNIYFGSEWNSEDRKDKIRSGRLNSYIIEKVRSYINNKIETLGANEIRDHLSFSYNSEVQKHIAEYTSTLTDRLLEEKFSSYMKGIVRETFDGNNRYTDIIQSVKDKMEKDMNSNPDFISKLVYRINELQLNGRR